jgi:hypothetical protein
MRQPQTTANDWKYAGLPLIADLDFSADQFVFPESVCAHIGSPFLMYSVFL